MASYKPAAITSRPPLAWVGTWVIRVTSPAGSTRPALMDVPPMSTPIAGVAIALLLMARMKEAAIVAGRVIAEPTITHQAPTDRARLASSGEERLPSAITGT